MLAVAKDGLKLPHAPLTMPRSVFLGAALAASCWCAAPVQAAPDVQVFSTQVTKMEVDQAQEAWCNALVSISAAYQADGFEAAKAKAGAVIDAAYAYHYGPVAFKPTLALGDSTFRPTREGALAYFVGPDPDISAFGENQGFATYRHWTQCEVDNYVVQLFGNTVNTMGLVKITDANGDSSVVEKTWGYLRDRDGSLRIVLHHSSVPVDAR